MRGDAQMHRRIWRLAGPIILSNLTVPLLGAVDTAVVGHLPDAAYLGAVALGALVFSYIYWGFGFLRMGTTGLAAQAWGRESPREIRMVFFRGLVLAAGFGGLIVALQSPIGALSFLLLDASGEVEAMGAAYVAIRIWGAPAALANYVVLGWFLGLQDARTPLLLQIVINGVNIVLDLVFVLGFGWGVEGVAAATLIAEVCGAVLGLILVRRRMRAAGGDSITLGEIMNWPAFRALMALNADILIRTLCLTTSFAIFTAQGATFGDTVLAANAVLLNFVSFAAFGLDGFAHAAEALVGGAKGRRDLREFRQAANGAFLWGGIVAVFTSLVFLVSGVAIVDLLTSIPAVREEAYSHLAWVIAYPVVSVWCFTLDGIYFGATRTAALRNASAASLAGFLGFLWMVHPEMGNHGLWGALTAFTLLRAVTLLIAYPALLRSVEDPDQDGRRSTATASR